jgi:hypothetical protein
MDDEATQLLREIRDIGLRNEARLGKDMAFRKRVLFAALAALVIALSGLGYVLHSLDLMTAAVEEAKPPAADRR